MNQVSFTVSGQYSFYYYCLAKLGDNWEQCEKYGNSEILSSTNKVVKINGESPKYDYSNQAGWLNLTDVLNYDGTYTINEIVNTFYPGLNRPIGYESYILKVWYQKIQ